MLPYVLAIAMCVLVQIWHTVVQQVMRYATIQLHHVTVQAVVQRLIVSHVLTLMVYADIQHVVVILAAMRMITVLPVQPVKPVVVARVLLLYHLDPPASIVQRHATAATVRGCVQHQLTTLYMDARHQSADTLTAMRCAKHTVAACIAAPRPILRNNIHK